jgi:hypothetical protein
MSRYLMSMLALGFSLIPVLCWAAVANPEQPKVIAGANVAGPHESYLESIYHSAAKPGGCLLTLPIGLAVFVGACIVAVKCRRPSVIASYLIVLPLPLIVGIWGAIEGPMHSLIIMSLCPTVQPSTPEITAGVATTLSTLFISIAVTLPSYLLVATVLIVRTAKAGRGSAE